MYFLYADVIAYCHSTDSYINMASTIILFLSHPASVGRLAMWLKLPRLGYVGILPVCWCQCLISYRWQLHQCGWCHASVTPCISGDRWSVYARHTLVCPMHTPGALMSEVIKRHSLLVCGSATIWQYWLCGLLHLHFHLNSITVDVYQICYAHCGYSYRSYFTVVC